MKIIKQIIGAVLIVAALASMLALSASAAGTQAYGAATVQASSLNIRSGQGTDYSIVGSIPDGAITVILDKTSDDWYHINYKGTEGYVASRYLVNVLTAENFDATGKVNGTDVLCRERPSTSNAILGTLQDYGTYTVVGINNGWYKIVYGSGYAYVRSDLMDIVGDGAATATASSSSTSSSTAVESYSGTGTVTGTYVRCRADASTDSEILGYFTYGGSYEVIGKSGSWYKVKYDSSTEGFIYGDYLRLSDGSSASVTTTSSSQGTSGGQAVADFALQYVGYDYVYGGKSPSTGFDCSGLVYYTYKTHFGFDDLWRGAEDQYLYNGTWVPKSDLVPGDLVFFSSDGEGVTHVGIYIGNQQFVHASTSRTGVIISNLDSSYYTSVYWGAKRLIWE